jgi:hypothetical protein
MRLRVFGRRERRHYRALADQCAKGPGEFAIRVSAVDDLFEPFDACPVAERRLAWEARAHVLDRWEWTRPAEDPVLLIYAPAGERADTDEAAVQTAVRADMRTNTQPLRRANPLNRHDRLAIWSGTIIFLISIVISTTLDDETHAVLIAGLSQAIVVIGWVALWEPAARLVGETLPHRYTRRRYAELTDVRVEFRWQ